LDTEFDNNTDNATFIAEPVTLHQTLPHVVVKPGV